MKNTNSLIALVFFFMHTSLANAQTCLLSPRQILQLVNATDDEREMALMPCFHKYPDKYRRDYDLNPITQLYDYDVIRFDEPGKISISTTNSQTYIAYKTALVAMGFTKKTIHYEYLKYRMVTGSTKNANGLPSYFISIYN